MKEKEKSGSGQMGSIDSIIQGDKSEGRDVVDENIEINNFQTKDPKIKTMNDPLMSPATNFTSPKNDRASLNISKADKSSMLPS